MPSLNAKSRLRPFFPVETGLWCWVGAPLFVSLLLAPTPVTLMGVFAVLAAFAATNALRARSLPGAVAAWGASLFGAVTVGLVAPFPGPWALAYVGAGLAGGALVLALEGRRRVGTAIAGRTVYEVGAIVLAGALGLGLAAASGRAADGLAAQCGVVTWELVGLWWVRRTLAAVLPGRGPAPLAVLLTAGASWAAAAIAAPILVALPLAYLVRVGTARPVSSARDARFLGLSEAAWTAAAGATAVALVSA